MSEEIKKKAKSAKPLMGLGRPVDLVTVSLTETVFKMVHAKQVGGKLTIQNVSSASIQGASDDMVADILLQFFKESNIVNEQVICALPSKLFISKNVEIPSTDREEISKIIDLQAGRFTPYSRDEVVIDFLCMETMAQHYTSVLLLITNRRVVERYFNIFAFAGVPIHKIAISAEALGVACLEMVPPEDKQKTLGVIHIAEESTDVIMMYQGQMSFVRSIPTGATHFRTSHDTAKVQFQEEFNKSLAAFQEQGIGASVERFFILGGVENLNVLSQEITTSSPLMQTWKSQVKEIDYQTHFQFGAKAMQQLREHPESSYFDLLATLTQYANLKIDLTPNDMKIKRRIREGGKDMMILGILVMTFFVLMSTFLAGKIYIKKSFLEKLDAGHVPISDQARLLERVSTKNRVVRQLLELRGKGLKIFDALSGLMGDDIYLSSFDYRDEGQMVLIGTAQSMSKVFAFVTKLEESNYFTDVKTKQTKTRREGPDDVADFEIECHLKEVI